MDRKMYSLLLLSNLIIAGMFVPHVIAANKVVVVPLGIQPVGNATASDVITDKTFSGDAGLGISGTMPNNGVFDLTCGTAEQTVDVGYYSGGTLATDPDLRSDNILDGVTIFGVTGNAASSGTVYNGGVGKTGQTVSDATGDDGDLQVGVAWPFPRFTINASEGSVTDNLTGLTWLQNVNCIQTNYPEFDRDITDPPPASCDDFPAPAGCGDGQVFWHNAIGFVAGVNAGTYPDCNTTPSQSDWRLPNRFELESLLDLGHSEPALSDTAGTGHWSEGDPFTNMQGLVYWSSTVRDNSSTSAWSIHFQYGSTHLDVAKHLNTNFVMLVRGGQ